MGTTSHLEPGPAVSTEHEVAGTQRPQDKWLKNFLKNILSLLLMTLEQKVLSATKMNKIIRIFLGQLCT